ncbi:MAG: ATP-dependent RNA helicase RhlB [Gammaproteobacteria bacterium]|jgi:ATP-dependent RNA helicase RhlB
MSEQHLTNTPLSSLNLPEALLKGIDQAGFAYCTPIQAKTLPLALTGVDVAGQAQTGTGKTAAYLLATMARLIRNPPAPNRTRRQPRALIVAPTRELAVQIHKDAELLGRYTDLRLAVVYGGAGYDTQRKRLEEGVDILIGTPGRLIDYFHQHIYDLKAAEVVVLDEADRMFDLGFIKDIRFLLRRLPKPEKRLSMLFSATLSFRVTELAYEHMNNPQLIQIESDKVTADQVREVSYYPANEEKIPLLIGLLRTMSATRTMVFVNTKRTGEEVHAYLESNGFHVATLSGDVPQKKRLKFLAQFEKGEIPILVATDVAARGLHIPDVSHVFNFDLPQDAEDYVHRIGRTARAGASGDAVSFVCETYAFSLPDIEKYIGHSIPSAPVSPELLAEVRRPKSIRRHRPDGKRGAKTRNDSRPGPRRRSGRSRKTQTTNTGPGT